MSASALTTPQHWLDFATALRPAPILDMPLRGGLPTPLRAGTRGSPLALVQTRMVQALLRQLNPNLLLSTEIIRTTGDAVQGCRLAEIGGKGLFSKEIHQSLLDGQIDFAVHSLKDLETEFPPGVVLACTLPREDPRDALILAGDVKLPDSGDPFATLPAGALIGSSSMRRQAQLLARRPDLRVALMRGNVETRLGKLANGSFAATFLAMAGLRRLNRQSAASVVLDPAVMVPAAGQGIVGITVRADDTRLRDLLGRINDRSAELAATAERAVLRTLDGSCRTPIGAFARLLPGDQLQVTGLVAREDGSFMLKRSFRGAASDAELLGTELGTSLWIDAPKDIFA
jgi:hydroxymethylbilane synthase